MSCSADSNGDSKKSGQSNNILYPTGKDTCSSRAGSKGGIRSMGSILFFGLRRRRVKSTMVAAIATPQFQSSLSP